LDKREILQDILADCLTHFSLPPLDRRRSEGGGKFHIVVDHGTSMSARTQNPWIGVILYSDVIEYRDEPANLRDGISRIAAPELREFLEKFVALDRLRQGFSEGVPKQYRFFFRVAYRSNGLFKGRDNGFATILERLGKIRDQSTRLRLYDYLNSERVQSACRTLSMPNEDPESIYCSEYAKPIELPAIAEVWGWLLQAIITFGRRPAM
jgi:hypothetical protein